MANIFTRKSFLTYCFGRFEWCILMGLLSQLNLGRFDLSGNIGMCVCAWPPVLTSLQGVFLNLIFWQYWPMSSHGTFNVVQPTVMQLDDSISELNVVTALSNVFKLECFVTCRFGSFSSFGWCFSHGVFLNFMFWRLQWRTCI